MPRLRIGAKPSRVAKKLPRTLTIEERESVYALCDTSTFIGLRNLALLRVMADAGLRISEALGIRDKDLKWEADGVSVIVFGKGSKDRKVWLGAADRDLLKQLIERKPHCEWLFCTYERNQLRSNNVRDWLNNAKKKLGLDRLHPHMLRHTFATGLLEATGNIMMVKEQLGHANLSSTERYLHVVDAERERATKAYGEAQNTKKLRD